MIKSSRAFLLQSRLFYNEAFSLTFMLYRLFSHCSTDAIKPCHSFTSVFSSLALPQVLA